jgi:hypothetical protein
MHPLFECNYSETDADCLPVGVGYFRARPSPQDREGTPHWGFPMPVYCDMGWTGSAVDASPR